MCQNWTFKVKGLFNEDFLRLLPESIYLYWFQICFLSLNWGKFKCKQTSAYFHFLLPLASLEEQSALEKEQIEAMFDFIISEIVL